jgi:hypothetical protein
MDTSAASGRLRDRWRVGHAKSSRNLPDASSDSRGCARIPADEQKEQITPLAGELADTLGSLFVKSCKRDFRNNGGGAVSDEIRVYVVKYPDRDNLVMRYRCPITNRQVSRSTGTTNAKEATKIAAKWEADLHAGRDRYASSTQGRAFGRRAQLLDA